MSGENQLIVTDEPVEFEIVTWGWVQRLGENYPWFGRICGIYFKLLKKTRQVITCKTGWPALETQSAMLTNYWPDTLTVSVWSILGDNPVTFPQTFTCTECSERPSSSQRLVGKSFLWFFCVLPNVFRECHRLILWSMLYLYMWPTSVAQWQIDVQLDLFLALDINDLSMASYTRANYR